MIKKKFDTIRPLVVELESFKEVPRLSKSGFLKTEYARVYRVSLKKRTLTSDGSKIITRHRMNMFLGVLERKLSILLKYVNKKI